MEIAGETGTGGRGGNPKRPGDRLEARCTRCNDVTGHIIVALVGGQVAKVECCACGSVHKYYPPRREKSVFESGVRRVRAGSDRREAMPASPARSKSAPRTERQAAAQEDAWRKALERPSAPAARAYALDVALTVGDVVDHPVFGVGVVDALSRPDKAHIVFREGIKTLRCSCS